MNKKEVSKVFGILKTKRKTKDLLMEYSNDEEKMFCAFASEKSLAKDWNTEEEEKVWKKSKHKK